LGPEVSKVPSVCENPGCPNYHLLQVPEIIEDDAYDVLSELEENED